MTFSIANSHNGMCLGAGRKPTLWIHPGTLQLYGEQHTSQLCIFMHRIQTVKEQTGEDIAKDDNNAACWNE